MIRSFSSVLVLWFRVFWVLFFDFIISYYYLFQVLEIEKSSTSSLMLQRISSVHSRPAIQTLPSNSCVVKYSMCTTSIMLNEHQIAFDRTFVAPVNYITVSIFARIFRDVSVPNSLLCWEYILLLFNFIAILPTVCSKG